LLKIDRTLYCFTATAVN